MEVVTLKLNVGWVIGSFLDMGFGGKTYNSIEGSGFTAHERLEWQGNIFVTHRILYPSGQRGNLLVMAPKVLSSTLYVKIPLMFR